MLQVLAAEPGHGDEVAVRIQLVSISAQAAVLHGGKSHHYIKLFQFSLKGKNTFDFQRNHSGYGRGTHYPHLEIWWPFFAE